MKEEPRVSLVHLGCARNLIDSELILGRMAEAGLMIAGDTADADYVVLNTCSFIGPAREESENAILDLLERKASGELRGVVVAGCLVQRYQHMLEKRFPGVDLFAEISDYRELARSVKELSEGRAIPAYLEAGGLRSAGRDGARLLSTPQSYSYLRISHGCDHQCSFCAIPSIRGPHRSKSLASVLDEGRELIDAGVRELVLVAEDSTAWGRDENRELPELVEGLADLGGARVRLMYAYPNRFPWALTGLLRDHENVVPYLDMPVQHISTSVLRAMRRAGSGDQVRKIVDRLREEVPDLTLRTTLLVGFPGETEEDVDELVEFVTSYGLGRVGVFTYSDEEGTTAFGLEGAVPAEVAEERAARVHAARDEVLDASQAALVGSVQEMIVDEVLDLEYGTIGRTDRDAPEVDMICAAKGAGEVEPGTRLQVRIDGLDEEFNLVGSVVEAP